MRVAELEVLFTADDSQVEATAKKAEATAKRVQKTPFKIDSDVSDAVAGMDRVEDQAKRLVSQDTALRVEANITAAQDSVDTLEKELDYLRAIAPSVQVDADIQRAENKLRGARRALDALEGARAEMEVDVDDSAAKSKLDGVPEYAVDAGDDAGKELGDNLVAALVSIPIAGAVIGVGAAVGKALFDGAKKALGQEAGRDRLAALTGLDEADASRLARAAGEAYANVFGESIESNMDTARLALQFGILDADASTRDAQKVVEGLAGIADVLGEDVKPVATAVTTLLSTGVAKSAQEAFDLIAAGERNGANRADDLLDTLTEYPALFARLGLEGEEALGLINQALEGGARNSDLAADALKEFQIRATDGSKASSDAYRQLGLDADDMTARIAAGGETARDGLALVLDKLRETEDPVKRNAAAVGLFGTQAEDLGDALFKMDLSNAVDQLDGVRGSAQRMFDTLAGNDATKIEQAQRNIEVAVSGIQGALAAAFSEPLGDFAEWVSQNRGPMLQFFADLVNGAIDFGISATESFGTFVSGPLADTVEGIASVIDVMNGFEGRPKELDELAESMRGFDETTDGAVLRLEEMRGQFNGFAEGQIALGHVNDAALRTASAVDALGGKTGSFEEQLRNAIDAMNDEIGAAARAGESQQNLKDRFNGTTDALTNQLVKMGYTEREARDLIKAYGAVPDMVSTNVRLYGSTEAERELERVTRERVARIMVSLQQTNAAGGAGAAMLKNGRGNIVEFMASGGLTPMEPLAQMVPANTWRVVGDRSDVSELFAPLDGSQRSWALLLEGIRRMPGSPPGAAPTSSPAQIQVYDNATYFAYDPTDIQRKRDEGLRRAIEDSGLDR